MAINEIINIEIELGIKFPQKYQDLVLNYPPEYDVEECGAEEFELTNYPDKLILENRNAYTDPFVINF